MSGVEFEGLYALKMSLTFEAQPQAMITSLLTATGRMVVWFGGILPLGDRLLDSRFRDDEGEHLMWGLGFYVSLILGAVSLLAWRR